MMLSIIVPVYNVEKYVEKCILSCINQTNSDLNHDYEIIIVNDGTPDSSMEIVERLTHNKPGITIINQENSGLSAARNKGIKFSKGDYLWFVDSDDWVSCNAVQQIVNKIHEMNFPDVVKIKSDAVYPDGTTKQCQRNFDSTQISNGRDEGLRNMSITPVQFSIYNKSWIIEHGLYFMNGVYHEDIEFTPKMYWNANRIAFINEVLYFYRQNPNSICHTYNPKKSYDLIRVSNSLSKFANIDTIQDEKFTISLNRLICTAINTSLNVIINCSTLEQKRFNSVLYENRKLIKHFKYSKKTIYVFEWIVFRLYPLFHYTTLYRSLQNIKSITTFFRG